MNKRLVGIFLVAGIALFSKDVRPINIQVVEAVTKQPVKNVVVYYELETVRMRNFLGIPIIDPLEYRFVIRSKYYTDENGYVKIPKQTVSLLLYEDLLLEYISINLDLNYQTNSLDEFFSNNDENKLINPIRYLKGAMIENTVADYKRQYSPSSNFKVIVNPESLKKELEAIVVELEAW